jgi:D-beta-D-heptose 7-phosphate kinase/D-beta-D-heptose 1-phosphate adenosyltransferase
MQPTLPRVLPPFSRARILVVGDVMLDQYWFGETQRISPEAPVPVVKVNNHDNRPGGAANVALNIAALGASVTLLGVTGIDDAGKILEEQLSAAQVKHDFYTEKTLTTIVKLRVISRQQQLLRLDFEEQLNVRYPNTFLAKYRHHVKNVDLVILSDYHKGTLINTPLMIELARKAKIPIIIDPKGTDYSAYKQATMITPNLKEFETVVGPCTHEEDIISKGRQLLLDLQISSILITRGEDGMTLVNKDEAHHLPTLAREVFDVTGAGDTVIGVLGTALAVKTELLAATAIANMAASLVVNKLGAATVSIPELEVALHGRSKMATGVVNEEQLLQAVQSARLQHKRIVFTNGCFDILHAGHVTSLQMAKALGDYLIVAVNSDESIRRLKGENRPINHLAHRMTVLAGLGVVDWVVPFADDTPERLLSLLKPDILAKGSDYGLEEVVGADIVRAYGGEIKIMQHTITTSSTGILTQLQNLSE